VYPAQLGSIPQWLAQDDNDTLGDSEEGGPDFPVVKTLAGS